MMTPLYIVLGIGAVMLTAVVILLLIALSRPSHFSVDRSIDIASPAAKIFSILEDLKLQRQWSTWDQMDPAMKRNYSGADRGVSATYEWDSKKMGAGRQKITAVEPNAKINIDLDFFRPFRASNKTEFLLKPAGNGTTVTWKMAGPAPLFHRVIGFIFCSDKMVEREFEKGLVQLKALAEK